MPPSRRPPSLGNDHFRPHVVGGGTQGTRGGVEVGPARAGQYRPVGCVRPDRHHPQPDPSNGVRNFPLLRRAAEDTLAHGHARVRNGHARAPRDTLAHRHTRAMLLLCLPPAGGPREPSPICSADENRPKIGSRKTGRFYDYPVRTFYGARTLPSSACRPTPAHWRTGALTHWRTGARTPASTAMPELRRLDSVIIMFLDTRTCCRGGG